MSEKRVLEEMVEELVADKPYPGLRPFEEGESSIFCGRNEQIKQVVGRLREKQFAAVVGGSGCGKSSLVWAGVIPSLQSFGIYDLEDIWLTIRITPGDRAIDRLAQQLTALVAPDECADVSERTEALLDEEPRALSFFMEQFGDRIVNPEVGSIFPRELRGKVNFLVFIDQFEEIFREEVDKRQAEILTRLIVEEYKNIKQNPRLHFILTMRSEFLDRCSRDVYLTEVLNETIYLARRLKRGEFAKAILEPPKTFMVLKHLDDTPKNLKNESLWPFEVTVPDVLLRAVYAIREDSDHLALLQHTLFWLWRVAYEEWRSESAGSPFVIGDRHLREVIHAMPERLDRGGGPASFGSQLLSECVNWQADAIYDRLSPDQQEICETLCKLIVQVDETGLPKRRFTTRADLKAIGAFDDADINVVINGFTTPHPYLRYDSDSEDGEITVAHEAFARNWRLYGDWFRADQRMADAYNQLLKSYCRHLQGREVHFNIGAYVELDGFERVPNIWLERRTSDFLSSPRNEEERNILRGESNILREESIVARVREYASDSRTASEREKGRYWLKAAENRGLSVAFEATAKMLEEGLAWIEKLGKGPERGTVEVMLQLMIAQAQSAQKGPASEEVESAYQLAEDLCSSLPESALHFAVLWSRWRVTMDHREGRDKADQLLELAEHLGDEGLILQAHHALWGTNYMLGNHKECLEHIKRGLEIYDEEIHPADASVYGGHDARVCGHGEAALSLWLQGYASTARERLIAAMDWAKELSQPRSRVHAYDFEIVFNRFRRRPQEVRQIAGEMIEFADKHGISEYESKGQMFQGWAATLLDDAHVAIRQLEQGFNAQHKSSAEEDFVVYHEMAAEAYSLVGRYEEALHRAKMGLELGEKRGIRFWDAELLRRMGGLHLAMGDSHVDEAEKFLKRAMEVARAQGARMLEIRAAVDLSHLWMRQQRPDEVGKLLTPLVEWFEGEGQTQETELKEAIDLVNRLS